MATLLQLTGLSLLICLPLYISLISLVKQLNRARSDAELWQQRYIAALQSLKMMDLSRTQETPPPPDLEGDLLDGTQ
jgi:hypothetical protein